MRSGVGGVGGQSTECGMCTSVFTGRDVEDLEIFTGEQFWPFLTREQ